MKAAFGGKCWICGFGFTKGAEINWDPESKKASHGYCFSDSADDSEALANRLGYRHYSWQELMDGCRPKTN